MNAAILKYSTWILFVCIGLFYLYETYTIQTHSSTVIENSEEIVHYAQDHLPKSGVLQEGYDGFVYLKVDDNYINQLYPLLHHSNYHKPPYFRRPNAPGAHISVFYTNERHRVGKIDEIGQRFSFTLGDLEIVPPHSREYIVLKVNAPELEKLRQKYGFQPLLQDHDFHITIAKKRHRPRNTTH
jgi:hypothetical protein